MSWYIVCDQCGVTSVAGNEPNLPEGWTQIPKSREHYCDGRTYNSACASVAKENLRNSFKLKARAARTAS